MCVDYTDLNKHYPKDPFGLPRIDQVIDSTVGCDLLCFLGCYSEYHQIAIKEEDQEKTETNRISADGNPTLSTSVVVPGGLPRAIPVSAMPKSIQKDKTKQIKYDI
jgi:hypothetical protein